MEVLQKKRSVEAYSLSLIRVGLRDAIACAIKSVCTGQLYRSTYKNQKDMPWLLAVLSST